MAIISGDKFFGGKAGTVVQSTSSPLFAKPPAMQAPTTPQSTPLSVAGDTLKETGKQVVEGVKKAFTAPQEALQRAGEAGAKGNLLGVAQAAIEAPLGMAAGAAQAVFAPLTGAILTSAKELDKATGGAISDKIEAVGKEHPEVLQKISDAVAKHPQIAQDIGDIVSLLGVKLAPAVGKILKDGASALAQEAEMTARMAGAKVADVAKPIVSKATETVVDTTKRATAKIIKATEPTPLAPTEAVGQVLQGKTSDIKSGVKGLSTIDTTGVKTYSDLSSKVSEKITELAGKVDTDLGADTTKRALSDLITTAKTTSGKTVTTTPVKDALSQLDELYTKTGDKLSAENIKELVARAETDGLTNLEINDIARVYGSEFKNKAFSKVGDPLTSVNAQMYENTRKSLKDLARDGIKGKEAQLADKQMSALYDVRTLIDKNVEAVNKLQQKIQERGLFEKAGHAVTKYGDILTGGSLRGLVGGLLPRGAGYKVLNALDIQETLAKNLELIQKAIKSGDDAEIIKILDSLNN